MFVDLTTNLKSADVICQSWIIRCGIIFASVAKKQHFFNTPIIKMILKQVLRTIFMKMSKSFFVCAKQCLISRPIHMTAFIGWLLIIIGNTDKFYQWNTSSIRKQLCLCPLKKRTCWPRKSIITVRIAFILTIDILISAVWWVNWK